MIKFKNISLEKIKNIPILWIAVASFALLLLRAWPRLIHPEIWDEDGTRNLAGFIANGAADIFHPVNGYLIVIPKLITTMSAYVSFTLYPLISTLLAWAFIVFVLVMIAKSKVHMKGGFFLTAACALVPSGIEVFGLPLYTFWWAALLLFLFAFWDQNAGGFWLRAICIALASLSSPVCLVTLPLFLLRACVFRKSATEIKLAIVATIFAGIQLFSMWPLPESVNNKLFSLEIINKLLSLFLGKYITGSILNDFYITAGYIVLLYIIVIIVRNRRDYVIWGLLYLLAAGILMTIKRSDINVIHHLIAGPRYFFFPFILLSWLLIHCVFTEKSIWLRSFGGAILLVSVVNMSAHITNGHDIVNWRGHVSSCSHFNEYNMPVHYDGNAAYYWWFALKGETCINLLKKDAFSSYVTEKTYPYKITPLASEMAIAKEKIPDVSRIKDSKWVPSMSYPITKSVALPSDFVVMGSFNDSKAQLSTLTVHLHRGEKILFQSSSRSKLQAIYIMGYKQQFFDKAPFTSEWNLLDFSSDLLPSEFDVQFLGTGNKKDEWSAVALKKTSAQ